MRFVPEVNKARAAPHFASRDFTAISSGYVMTVVYEGKATILVFNEMFIRSLHVSYVASEKKLGTRRGVY